MWHLIKAQLEYFKKQVLISWLIAVAVSTISAVYISSNSEINPEVVEQINFFLFFSIVPITIIFSSFSRTDASENRLNLFYSLPLKPFTTVLSRYISVLILTLPSLATLSISTLFVISSGITISPVSFVTFTLFILGMSYYSVAFSPFRSNKSLFTIVFIPMFIFFYFIFFTPIMSNNDSLIPFEAYDNPSMLTIAFLFFVLFSTLFYAIQMFRYKSKKIRYAADEIVERNRSQSYNIATERNQKRSATSLAFKGLVKYNWYYVLLNIVLLIALHAFDFMMRFEGESSREITTFFKFYSSAFTILFISYSFARLRQEKITRSLIAAISSPRDVLIIQYKFLSLFILPHFVLIILAFLIQTLSGLYTNLLLELNALFLVFILSQFLIITMDNLEFGNRLRHDSKLNMLLFSAFAVTVPVFISDFMLPQTTNIILLLLLILVSVLVNFKTRKSFLNRESYL